MNTDNRTNEPRRLKSCVEAWPECETGEYNPSCCRFPKSCSATVYSEEHVTEDDLEPPAALVAAQGAARPVNSFDTTAERVKTVADSLHVAPQETLGDPVFRAAAAIAETQARRQNLPPEVIQGVTREHMQDAKAALTAAGVAPQEPNQNETKSGNNFVSLDPEKVADVIEIEIEGLRHETRLYPDIYKRQVADALCEAYTEGRLT